MYSMCTYFLALQKFQVHEDTSIAYEMQSAECKWNNFK
jgi:hypothetical protein